ncbi:BQ5605_C019g09005 [Microbotryum silenes-dioicae]|uniref:BQ5605_C019g09005 protein n=1 Tax=Microbotryum silenes-dioicae TaxID=796604 RepID=A0A2X0M0A6_9BASI|nr:BQ5605_C019g09005 [Microbotryum silenes-dioicae]
MAAQVIIAHARFIFNAVDQTLVRSHPLATSSNDACPALAGSTGQWQVHKCAMSAPKAQPKPGRPSSLAYTLGPLSDGLTPLSGPWQLADN